MFVLFVHIVSKTMIAADANNAQATNTKSKQSDLPKKTPSLMKNKRNLMF